MWSIVFFLGILYTTFYNLIKYRYNSFSLLVIYSYICLPLFLFGHDELFLTGVILSRNVYLFIFMILLIKFLKLRRSKIYFEKMVCSIINGDCCIRRALY